MLLLLLLEILRAAHGQLHVWLSVWPSVSLAGWRVRLSVSPIWMRWRIYHSSWQDNSLICAKPTQQPQPQQQQHSPSAAPRRGSGGGVAGSRTGSIASSSGSSDWESKSTPVADLCAVHALLNEYLNSGSYCCCCSSSCYSHCSCSYPGSFSCCGQLGHS